MQGDEEYQRLLYESSVYREQLNLLQREIDKITLATLDLNNAASTTGRIADGEGLIPIGGGAFVKGILSSATILVPVGAGYMVDMPKAEAEAEIRKRIDATEKAIARLNEEFRSIAGKLQDATTKGRKLRAQISIDRNVEAAATEDYV